MKRFFALAGLALVISPIAAIAQEQNLYELFHEQTNREYAKEEFDETVIEFVRSVYQKEWDMSGDEIKAALNGNVMGACGTTDDGSWAAEAYRSECGRALPNIKLLANEEQHLRAFGRDLQRMASAQELPLSEIPERPFHMATDLSGIVNIWRAGTGSVQKTASGILVRTKDLTTDQIKQLGSKFEGIEQRLSDEEPEWSTSAVWHFQYGVRLLAGSRNPDYPPPFQDDQSGPGTERQYIFHDDWLGLDQTLIEIWDILPKDRDDFDPPLSDNETAYILFTDSLQGMLPPNVLVWARVDGASYEPGAGEGNHPLGDVGLAWKYPTEPLLPSLISLEENNPPILGGRYPPEPAYEASSDEDGNPLPAGQTKAPIDGRGLCSMALAQRGYLCRPLRVTDEDQCPAPEDTPEEENVITLLSCTVEEQPTLTEAGPDVCREIEYLNGEQSQRCSVVFEQGGCPGGQAASASEKAADGTIRVCLDDSTGITITYPMEHELVHAQQFCSMPAGDIYGKLDDDDADALCCRLEGEAHLVSCKRMMEDGVLNDDDGNPLVIDGIEITPHICMELMRIVSCNGVLGREVACPMSTTLDLNDAPAVIAAMKDKNPEDLPDTYDEATDLDTMDAKIAARLRTVERQIPVCTPGTESEYKNTIGNNACYIGQCVEESLELHRLTGGRSPATVGDGAFPHDDPRMGEALATVLRSVPATSPPLPSYRPQMITRILEDALCQLQGLPAATPPHLCAFSPSRRLAVPLADGAATARSLQYDSAEQREATLLVERLAAGLGSRIGTDIQGQYLRIGTRTLSEVVALANMLLKEAITVTFPTNMCPLSIDV